MAERRVALITGVTGQDGSYLSELLLEKGYVVHGLIRRNSDFTTRRIDRIFFHERFVVHYGDLSDASSMHAVLAKAAPTEIYNLAAQSHVGVSFSTPDYSAQVNGLGTLRLLSAIRDVGLDTRFYQASTSEMFGGLPESTPQSETTAFTPRSPYATSKLFAHWATKNYRLAYGLHASNGILFNHESPRRGRNFVTKKVTQAVARIARGEQQVLRLGNLTAERDWGYAPEYVDAMWRMLQQPSGQDLVIGTGEACSVRQFVEYCFLEIGIELRWSGRDADEVGRDARTGEVRVAVESKYFRPLEVDRLRADPRLAAERIGWTPTVRARELARIMVRYDLVHDEYGFPDRVTDEQIAARVRLPSS